MLEINPVYDAIIFRSRTKRIAYHYKFALPQNYKFASIFLICLLLFLFLQNVVMGRHNFGIGKYIVFARKVGGRERGVEYKLTDIPIIGFYSGKMLGKQADT